MKKRAPFVFSALVGAGAVGACSYEALTASETDTVFTLRDEGRDYGAYRTYALSDGVFELCGLEDDDGLGPLPMGGAGGAGGFGGRSGLDADDCYDIGHDHDTFLRETIAEAFDDAGFVRVEDRADADLVVLVGVVARDYWFISERYVWCDPFYDFSCWYPSTEEPYGFPVGSVVINAIDTSESKSDDLSSVWFASLSGVYADSNEANVRARIDAKVAQAFSQSSYLEADGAE